MSSLLYTIDEAIGNCFCNYNVFLTIGRPTFLPLCSKFFVDGETRIKEIFEEFDPDNSGMIDYITWSMMLSPRVRPEFVHLYT